MPKLSSNNSNPSEKLNTQLDPHSKSRQEELPLQVYEYLIPNLRIHPWLQDNIIYIDI